MSFSGDWFSDPVNHAKQLKSGNRYCTVLLYLSYVEEGGETTLPLAEAINKTAQKLDGLSECAAGMGIAVRPKKGDALMFFDMDIMVRGWISFTQCISLSMFCSIYVRTSVLHPHSL